MVTAPVFGPYQAAALQPGTTRSTNSSIAPGQ